MNPGPTPLVLLSYLMLMCASGAGHGRAPPRARNYSTISATTPEPTVRPPSRMAKRRP